MSENTQVQRTKAAVLQAARELLLEIGPAELTYTAVATRSNVTRQTVYRHWPTRETLLTDIVLTGPDVAYPSPGANAGTVIIEFLHSLRAGMNDEPTGAALMALAGQAHHDPISAAALTAITDDRRNALNVLLAPSGQRISESEFAQLCGPVMFQRFIAHRHVTDKLINSTVDAWLAQRDEEPNGANDLA